MPTIPEALAIALQHHQGGRLQAAEQIYRQILQAEPNHVDAIHLLGVMAYQLGKLDAAVASYHRALELNPELAEAHSNLGAALKAQGKLNEAVACYRRALELNPELAEAHNNLGAALGDQGQLDEAVACYRRALALKPGYAEAHYNLGAAVRDQGQLDEAVACYRRALALKPDYAAAGNNLGNILREQWKLNDAIASYRRALEHQPNYAEAHFNLGNVFKDQGKLDEAVACYRRALEHVPGYAEAHDNLGMALHEQGRHEEALEHFERASAIQFTAGRRIRSQLALPLILDSIEQAERERQRIEGAVEQLLTDDIRLGDPVGEVGSPPFFLAYLGCNVRGLLARIAQLYARAAPALGFVAPHCVAPEPFRSDRKIRVGFLSRFFYAHPVGLWYAGLLGELARDSFHVAVLKLPGPEDAVSKTIENHAQTVVTLRPQLEAARQAVAREELDVLVYTDIGMDALTYYLAFSRLAPVQCALPGHPVTTGIPTIDYFLSSVDLEPEGTEAHYTERLVQFESLPTTFEFPAPPPARSREELGLDRDAHLYLCVQTLFKIYPEFDALVAGVLAADPQGRVVFFEGNQRHWTALLRARLNRVLGDAIQRVDFLPRQDLEGFRQALALADVVLDTTHFSGATTTLETLALGLPIVTLPGEFMRGRQTLACYRKLGVLDCVASDPNDYLRIAVRLANDADWRQQISTRICAARHQLFDSTPFIRELEAFFVHAVRYNAGHAKCPSTSSR